MAEYQITNQEVQKNVLIESAANENENLDDKCFSEVLQAPQHLVFEEESAKRLEYLKEIFIKSCIDVLQSKLVGSWIHLLEVLTLMRPFSELLLRSENIFHYLVRIYDFCQQHEDLRHLNIPSTLTDIFPNIDFNIAITTSISTLNTQSSNLTSSGRTKFGNVSVFEVIKEPYLRGSNSIFRINSYDLQDRKYEPKQLSVIDIQRHLPRVVSDIARLESTWSNALGLTVTSLNTDIPQEILDQRSPSPSFITTSSFYTLNDETDVSSNKHSKSTQLKTGRDVIECLVKTGRQKEVHIFYLNIVPSVVYNPYNLVLATKSTIKKEHVVMSMFGVLHVRHNGNSDLTPLGQWYMEAVCFDTMKNISFFRYFHLIKSFKKWKEHLMYSKFLCTRKRISSTHLYSIPSVPQAMLKINHLVLQMDDIKLLPSCREGEIQIIEFESFVFSQLHIAGKIFQRLFTLALNVLNKCHEDCINYYRYCQDQVDVDIQPQESLTIARKRKKQQFRNKEVAENNLVRFALVIKLVNSMIASQLIWKLSKKIDDFIYQELHGNQKGCFYCVVNILDTGVSLKPTETDFYDVIIETFNNCLVKLENLYFKSLKTAVESFVESSQKESGKPVLGLDMLKSFLEVNIAKEMEKVPETVGHKKEVKENIHTQPISIRESVLSQPIITAGLTLLKDAFSNAYEEVKEFLSSYDWVEEVIHFVDLWDSKQFEEQAFSVVSSIESHITQMKLWQKNLQDIKASYVTKNGLLFVDLLPMRDILVPKLQTIFMDIIKVLTLKNSKETRVFFKELTELCEKLTILHSDVEGFAKYFVFVNKVHTKVPILQKKVDMIKALYDLIKHCHRQLTTDEERQEQKMWMLWEKAMFALQIATNYVNAELPLRVEQLNNDIKKLLDKADHIVARSTSGEFLEAKHNASGILKKLKEHYEEFNTVYQKLQLYAKCLEMITGVKENIEGLTEGQKRIHSRYELWKYLELSTQTIKEWKHTVFFKFQVSIKKVLEKVQNWKAAVNTLQLEIPKNDAVFANWLSVIQEFNEGLTVLQELSNPALKQHHWKEIFVVLGQVYDPCVTYRVNDIVSMEIINNAKKIHQISLSASSERALKQCLQNLVKQWEKKDFKFKKDTNKRKTRNGSRDVKQRMKKSYVLTGVDELIYQAEDSLVTLQSMLVSPHVMDVKDLVNHWNTQLQETKQILETWMSAQKQWIYLGQIFSLETSQSNHPLEYKIFMKQDVFFKELIEITIADSKVLHVLEKTRSCKGWREYQGSRLKELLSQAIQEQGEAIRGLNMYLSKVKEQFPRLYFWSDEELIHLLTISYNPHSLVPVVQKCFPGVFDVKFEVPQLDSNDKLITSIDTNLDPHLLEAVAIQGNLEEVLIFEKALPSDVAIVDWLNLIENVIQKGMRDDVRKCLVETNRDYGNQVDFKKWSENNLHRKHSFQALLLYYDVTMSNLLQDMLSDPQHSWNKVRDYVCADVSNFSIFIQTTKLWSFSNGTDRRCLLLVQTLLTKTIHFRDQLAVLESSCNENTFDWLQTVRYSCNNSDPDEKEQHIKLHCFGYEFDYSYEYHGPSQYIVCTPFTERCIFAILIAMQQYQVGCLFGSVGNGKSAVCSHVSKMLGRHFITLNCTQETSVDVFGQFLHGALRVGCFICIDQINKLPAEVLSITAQFFESIRQGLMANLEETNTNGNNRILLNGQLVDASCHYGCVLTTNQNIMQWRAVPDNLRRNLHPISLQKPDLRYVFEAWFTMHGFRQSTTLAQKLQTLVDIFRQEDTLSLSKIKGVISAAGHLIRNEKVEPDQELRQFIKIFLTVFKSSVHKSVFAKLIFHVAAIFSMRKESLNACPFYDSLLTEAVKEQIMADNLCPKLEFINKVLDLHKVLSTNQSVVIYGPCCSGKTTCYKTLARALCQFYSPWSQQQQDCDVKSNDVNFTRVDLKVVYPNVMDCSQLYGYFDSSSQTWADGLLTKLLTAYPSLTKTSSSSSSKEPFGQVQPWLVLDGTMNSEWVSGIDALLDQQKTSVLKNGRQVYLGETSRLIFEVETLASCSPSLLSRSAMLYFPPKQVVDWKAYFYSWQKTAHNNSHITLEKIAIIEEALAYTLVPCVKFIHRECEQLLSADLHIKPNLQMTKKSTYIAECTHLLHILSALFHYWIPRDQVSTFALDTMDEGFITKFVCNALAFAFAHSMAALVHSRSYPKLDIFIRQIFSTCPPCSVIFPSNFLDCYFDGSSGELKPWNEQKAQSRVPLPPSSFTLTKEIQQCYMLTELLILSHKNCLIVGDVGSGKTSFVKSLLSIKYSFTKIQLSKALTVEHFQKLLLNKTNHLKSLQTTNRIVKKAKNFDTTGGKMLFFIDDLNVAEQKEFEQDQPFYEYVRQLNAEGGCYDLKGNFFHYLPFLQMVLTYTLPASDELSLSNSSCLLTPKFLRHFFIIRYPTLSTKDLVTIYNRACQSWLSHFDWLPWKLAFSKAIVSASINIHQRLSKMFSPSICLLYKFSLHDLAKVFKNLVSFKLNIDEHVAAVLCSSDIESLVGREQHFINKSVSEFLIEPSSKATLEIYDLLREPMKEFIQVWCNELKYVYGKRFSKDGEDSKLYDVMDEEIKSNFNCDTEEEAGKKGKEPIIGKMDALPRKLMQDVVVRREEIESASSYFLHSINEADNLNVYKRYNIQTFQDMVLNSLKELELSDLFINNHVLDHIATLSKAISCGSGHALLVSYNGHGRKNVVKVVANLLKMQMFELAYVDTMNDYTTVIKDACNTAGLNGKHVVLFAAEMLPKDVHRYLATLICDGMCPGLYTANELLLTCTQLLPGGHLNVRKTSGYASLEERFFQRIKTNLHIVIAKSYYNVKRYLQEYPVALHKMACIDVYREYTASDWLDFASRWFVRCGAQNVVSNHQQSISSLIAEIHCSAGSSTSQHFNRKGIKMFSPLKFFECLQIFYDIYNRALAQKKPRLTFLENAMSKVEEAETEISKVSRENGKMTALLQEATQEGIEAKRLLKETRREYLQLKNSCDAQYGKIKKLKEPREVFRRKAEQDFNQLSPLYEAALAALNVLDYHAIDELKSYYKPPEGVIFVAQMLCVLFDAPHQGWEDSKLLLMRDNFLQDVQFFDKDNISDSTYKKLCEFVANPMTGYVENVSKAADQLKIWLQAIHSYATIFRQLQPKKRVLKAAEKKILQAERELCAMKLHCDEVEEDLKEKQSLHKKKVHNTKVLQDKIEELDKTKSYVKNLLSTMKPFTNEWQSELEELQKGVVTLPHDCLLMAASIVYLGVHSKLHQDKVKKIWLSSTSLENSSHFTLATILSTEDEQNKWARQINVENPALVENLLGIRSISQASKKCWPLLIDPNDEAEKYVNLVEKVMASGINSTTTNTTKNSTSSTNNITGTTTPPTEHAPHSNGDQRIIVIDASHKALDETLLKALRDGLVMVVKNIEHAPASKLLKSIMCRERLKDHNIMVSKHHIDCSLDFRLYLSTSLSLSGLVGEELDYPLHRTICFNMETDKRGLGHHFLKTIISWELPELEIQHQRVELDVQFLKREKKEVQVGVLKKVTGMPHGLFIDKEFLHYIGFQREHLWLVEERMLESQVFFDNVRNQSNDYQPLATFLSTVYEILQKISRVNPLYQFNMLQLNRIVDVALQKSQLTRPAAASTQARVDEIKSIVTKEIFQRSCDALFQEHSLLFPICLVLEEMKMDLNITAAMMERFLLLQQFDECSMGTATSAVYSIFQPSNKPDWIEENSWSNFVGLARSGEQFNKLLESLQHRSAEWKEYFHSNISSLMTPYMMSELNTFEVALLWIAYNKNVLPSICEEFVLCKLGPDYLNVPSFNFSIATTHPQWIQMVVLPDNDAPVAKDPYEVLLETAKCHDIPSLTTVCMGDDGKQFANAEDAIDDAVLKGGWVVLQNCHLVKKWSKGFLTRLESLLQTYKQKNTTLAVRFRIWMILRWRDSLVLPERILKKSRILVWQTLKGEELAELYKSQSGKEDNSNLFEYFSKEVDRNHHRYYSLPYQITNREFNSMVSLKKQLNQQQQMNANACVVRDATILPQFTSRCDEQLYQHESVFTNQSITTPGLDMVDVYFTMLHSYFNFKSKERPLCHIKRIEHISHQFSSLKDKFVYQKQTHMLRPGIFQIIHEESMQWEQLVDKIVQDLTFIQRALNCYCPYTEQTLSIHRAITNGETPLEWLRNSLNEFVTDSPMERIPLDSFFKSVDEKLSHFNHVIDVPSTKPVVLELKRFSNPAHILNAVRLQHSIESEDPSHMLTEDWIAQSITAEHASASIKRTTQPRSRFHIKDLEVYKTEPGSKNKLSLPFLSYKPKNEVMEAKTEKTIEVYHQLSHHYALSSRDYHHSRQRLFTIALSESDDEELFEDSILLFHTSCL